MDEKVMPYPLYEETVGDTKTFMRAIQGDVNAHQSLHQLSRERLERLMCTLTSTFEGLRQHHGWFKRFVSNWIKTFDEMDESQMREFYRKVFGDFL